MIAKIRKEKSTRRKKREEGDHRSGKSCFYFLDQSCSSISEGKGFSYPYFLNHLRLLQSIRESEEKRKNITKVLRIFSRRLPVAGEREKETVFIASKTECVSRCIFWSKKIRRWREWMNLYDFHSPSNPRNEIYTANAIQFTWKEGKRGRGENRIESRFWGWFLVHFNDIQAQRKNCERRKNAMDAARNRESESQKTSYEWINIQFSFPPSFPFDSMMSLLPSSLSHFGDGKKESPFLDRKRFCSVPSVQNHGSEYKSNMHRVSLSSCCLRRQWDERDEKRRER